MSHDNIKDHVKVYWFVFIALLILTVLTVGVSYFEFGGIVWLAIGVGLAIAFFKGYLVAANFMHLNNEKSTIYWTLIMTVVFFIVLFFMPIIWEKDTLKSPDSIPSLKETVGK